MLEPTRKDTLHSKTKEKTVRREEGCYCNEIKSDTQQVSKLQTGGEKKKLQKLAYRRENSEPKSGFPALGSSNGGVTRESDFESQRSLITEIPQD